MLLVVLLFFAVLLLLFFVGNENERKVEEGKMLQSGLLPDGENVPEEDQISSVGVEELRG